MIDVESYRQYAADCLRQAETQRKPADKNILLNVALAWVRLARQVQQVAIQHQPEDVIEAEYHEIKTEAAEAGDRATLQPDAPQPAHGKIFVTH